MTGVRVELDGIRVEAGGSRILDVAALDFPAGQTTAVLGRNGAGKSTLARVAIGLLSPAAGRVLLDGRPATPAERRAIAAAVLQRPLLGRGSARRNAELGLRFAGVARAETRRRAGAWLDRLGVAHLADRPARSLSGGEAQRISLARALVLEPRLLVLDEPFAPLDAAARGALLEDLRTLLAEDGGTTLLVTHDPGEAAALASHIAVLGNGLVRQHGPTATVFAHPADTTTARLLGYDNVLAPQDALQLGIRATAPIAFRAADLTVTADPQAGDANVLRSLPVAGASHVVIERGAASAVGMCALPGGLPPGTRVSARLLPERCRPIGATTDTR